MLSLHHITVLNAFQSLLTALSQFRTHLCEHDIHYPLWFEPPKELPCFSGKDRENAFTFISQLEYLDEQPPKEILVGAGLIAASKETIQHLEQLNTAKEAFKAAMLDLKKTQSISKDLALNDGFEELLNKRPEGTKTSLRKIGLSRLHLKQCYRKIPWFKEKPKAVSWTWANTKAITRISVQEAEALLRKQGNDPGIQIQLQKLAAINPKEPLAIVQTLAPHLRVNVVFEDSLVYPKRLMVKGPVPLFYLDEDKSPLPKIRPPGPKKGRDEKKPQRKDVKLDPEPFLPSLRIHRYSVCPSLSL